MIHVLPDSVSARLRSGVAITSVTQCVEELVLNSLDAGANCIAIRLDLPCFKVQVVDNGGGIPCDQLELIANRYSTSKCHGLEDLENLKYYGYRGEALASMQEVATMLEIVSRHRLSTKTYSKLFHNGKALPTNETKLPRPSAGTTITVHDLFNKLPVRKCTLNENLEVERVRHRLEAISLVHPNVSFSLRNDNTGNKILQTLKSSSIVGSFTHLFGAMKASCLREVKNNQGNFSLEGFLGKDCHFNKNMQFVYINGRLVLKTRIHKLLNKALTKCFSSRKLECSDPPRRSFYSPSQSSSPTKQSEKYGIFVLDIKCPLDEYDITSDPTKTLVEFKDWDALISAVEKLVQDFQQHLGMAVAEEKTKANITTECEISCSGSQGESKISVQSDKISSAASYGKSISPSLAANSLHSKVVRRLGSTVTKDSEKNIDLTIRNSPGHIQIETENERVCGSLDDAEIVVETIGTSDKCDQRISSEKDSSTSGALDDVSIEITTDVEEGNRTQGENPLLTPVVSQSNILFSTSNIKGAQFVQEEQMILIEDSLATPLVSSHKTISDKSDKYIKSVVNNDSLSSEEPLSPLVLMHQTCSNMRSKYSRTLMEEDEDPLSPVISKNKTGSTSSKKELIVVVQEDETMSEDPLSPFVSKHKIKSMTSDKYTKPMQQDKVMNEDPLFPLISNTRSTYTTAVDEQTDPNDSGINIDIRQPADANRSSNLSIGIQPIVLSGCRESSQILFKMPAYRSHQGDFRQKHPTSADGESLTHEAKLKLEQLRASVYGRKPGRKIDILSETTINHTTEAERCTRVSKSKLEQLRSSTYGTDKGMKTGVLSDSDSADTSTEVDGFSREAKLKFEQLRASVYATSRSMDIDASSESSTMPFSETEVFSHEAKLKFDQLRATVYGTMHGRKACCSSESNATLQSLDISKRKCVSRDSSDLVIKPKSTNSTISISSPPRPEIIHIADTFQSECSTKIMKPPGKVQCSVMQDFTARQHDGRNNEMQVNVAVLHRKRNAEGKRTTTTTSAKLARLAGIRKNGGSSVSSYSSAPSKCVESGNQQSNDFKDSLRSMLRSEDNNKHNVGSSNSNDITCRESVDSNLVGGLSRLQHQSCSYSEYLNKKDSCEIIVSNTGNCPVDRQNNGDMNLDQAVKMSDNNVNFSSAQTKRSFLTTESLMETFAPALKECSAVVIGEPLGSMPPPTSPTGLLLDITRLRPTTPETQEVNHSNSNNLLAQAVRFSSPDGDIRLSQNNCTTAEPGEIFKNYQSAVQQCSSSLLAVSSDYVERSVQETNLTSLSSKSDMNVEYLSQGFSYDPSQVPGELSRATVQTESQGFQMSTPSFRLYTCCSTQENSQNGSSLDCAVSQTRLSSFKLPTNLDDSATESVNVGSDTISPEKDLVDMLVSPSSGDENRGPTITLCRNQPAFFKYCLGDANSFHSSWSGSLGSESDLSVHAKTGCDSQKSNASQKDVSQKIDVSQETDYIQKNDVIWKADDVIMLDTKGTESTERTQKKDPSCHQHESLINNSSSDNIPLSEYTSMATDNGDKPTRPEPSTVSQMWSPDVDSALLTVECSCVEDSSVTSDSSRYVLPCALSTVADEKSVEEGSSGPANAEGSLNSHEMIELKDHKSGWKIYIHPLTGHSMDELAWELWKRRTTEASEGKNHLQKKQQLLSHDLVHLLAKPKPDDAKGGGQTSVSVEKAPDTGGELGELWEDHMTKKSTEDMIKWRNPNSKMSDQDSSVTVDSLADLFEDWDNPVFSLPEEDVISAELSRVKTSAVKVHKALHPCRFSKSMLTSAQVIGQVDEKFIACLMSNDEKNLSAEANLVVMVDQHAAHERVRLEQLTEDAHSLGDAGQKVIKRSEVTPPIKLVLAEEAVRIMKAYRAKFEDIGLDFGVLEGRRDSVLVKSAPACFVEREANERKRGRDTVITDMVEMLIKEQVDVLTCTHGVQATLPSAIHKLLCSQACHGAIKFGDSLSIADCTDLVESLSLCNLPFQCAHGRPAIMPLLDLDYYKSKFPQKSVKKPQLWKLRKCIEESEQSENIQND